LHLPPARTGKLDIFSAYQHMAAENPDLVIFLGDYIYESTATGARADRVVRKHDGPAAVDLAGYRNRYALYRTDPDLQALHGAASCLMTWDDHEVENDYADEWSELVETKPEDFLRRRAAAYQAYYEHMPLRAQSKPQGSASRLYDRFRFGDLVTISVLDGRQYRTKQPCELPKLRRGHIAPDSCTERIDPQRSYLGAQQEQWLFEIVLSGGSRCSKSGGANSSRSSAARRHGRSQRGPSSAHCPWSATSASLRPRSVRSRSGKVWAKPATARGGT
jgi:alkaline phosphatase D